VAIEEEESTEQQNGTAGDEVSVLSDDSDISSPPKHEPVFTTLDVGPFAGLPFPHRSARANAAHFVRECVSTYLITHPHLDHLAGFVINTAAFHNTSRPKKLAGLPSTVNAIKIHLFNDVIWPNLTDEDGGVGFVTFQRLTDGGNIAVGEGFGSSYIEVCDGLCVRGMKITHGHCSRPLSAWPHRASDVGLSEATTIATPTINPPRHPSDDGLLGGIRATRTPSTAPYAPPATPGGSLPGHDATARRVTVDSTAYFIRDDATGREVLMFGDVEPDAVSLNPRTAQVWAEAAPRIAAGVLRAVCIECSYEDAQHDAVLFGHLAPRHLVHELQTLARMVRARRADDDARRELRKRKRSSHDAGRNSPRKVSKEVVVPLSSSSSAAVVMGGAAVPNVYFRTPLLPAAAVESGGGGGGSAPQTIAKRRGLRSARITELGGMSPRTVARSESPPPLPTPSVAHPPPLAGLTVIIMHVKDTLRDGAHVGASILRELEGHEARLKEMDGIGLGCTFVMSRSGGSYFF